MIRLFFYGTLMSGGPRAHVLSNLARPVGPAEIEGDLYEVGLGMFPAFVPGDGIVHGEVWDVLPGAEVEALRICDMIEGYRPGDPRRSMYVRERRPVLDGSGDVFVYRWNDGAEALRARIPDGRWRNVRRPPLAARA